jgi:phage tail sheath gpL-like
VAQVSRINIGGTVATTDTASVVINGVTITSAAPSAATGASLATALETAINNAITAGTVKNISVTRTNGVLDITSTVAGSAFELIGAKVINTSVATATTMSLDTVTANSHGNSQQHLSPYPLRHGAHDCASTPNAWFACANWCTTI